jgi:hypothetical protein
MQERMTNKPEAGDTLYRKSHHADGAEITDKRGWLMASSSIITVAGHFE